MFNANDTKLWVRRQCAEDNWNSWYTAMTGALRQQPGKVTIVEVGAGVNVPSLRFQSERLLHTILDNHRACPAPTLVRINPDHPGVDETKLQPLVISIRSRGLAALRAIDDAMETQKLNSVF